VRHSWIAILWLAATLGAGPAGAAVERIAGIFAAANATPRATASLTVERAGPLEAKLDLWEAAHGSPIRNYDLDMTKRLHMIVISDDFRSFQHVHPTLGPDGHFTIDLRVPKPGRYEIYADAVPHGLGNQVFRFPVIFGRATPAAPDLSATGKTANAGPYTVSLGATTLRASAMTMLNVRITKNGAPAEDLRPYLGAAAHAVFIDAATLDYVHVHPLLGTPGMGATGGMNMPGMDEPAAPPPSLPDDAKVPASFAVHVSPVRAGRYKLWLQFRGSNGLNVAPFVLDAN
jgi:hypothetical protein